MRRLLGVGILSLTLLPAALVLAPSEAAACSCIPTPGALESARDSDAVFAAKLVSVSDAPKAGPHDLETKNVTFEVTRTFKGQLDAQININTAANSAACGRNYGDPGSEWLVYARIDDQGQARDNLCSRTRPLADAAADIVELEANADTLDQPNEAPSSTDPGPADPEPEPVLPGEAGGEAGPEPTEPSKKGCALADTDPGAGGLAGLLGLGLVVGWARRRRSGR
ncbi:hypothetical protein ENSA5_52490 [Enhygromyxa salina]|uniref:Uncharacterized protein n=1 Tax=Enhygromyxa salina TaxID=215803 RepID=A0A2S9XG32_9BACT|nr:MYXO-CTERM sorting domain-containing protein [Enhygromyxa salina]PRP91812.1 hypothetical protein ENSA5_52490 [Enhygromyxa salina]